MLGFGLLVVGPDDLGDLLVGPDLVLEQGDQGAPVVGGFVADQGPGLAVDQQDGVAEAGAVAVGSRSTWCGSSGSIQGSW